MNHIRLRSSNFVQPAETEMIPEAVLDENDPIQDMRRMAGLPTGLNAGQLHEYSGYNSVKTEGSNISGTAMEKINYQNDNNVQPGSPEWFRLWFSKPYLTGEKPF